MKEYFGAKKATQVIGNGETVKMSSTDFKTHLFSLSKNYRKPVLHEIRRSIGKPLFKELTYDEFKEQFKENEFYKYETVS